MRNSLVVLVLVAGLSSEARAEWPRWAAPSAGESLAMGGAGLLVSWDIAQTCAGLARSPGVWEANPLLGRRPSCAKVVVLGGLAGLASAGVWLRLPPKVRYVVPVCVGILEGLVIADRVNQVGLKMTFSF